MRRCDLELQHSKQVQSESWLCPFHSQRICLCLTVIDKCQKDIEIYCNLWKELYHISISFLYSAGLYTSQVLKVARNVKNCIFLLILSNATPNKFLFRHSNPKSKPNPETLVIPQHKNTNILILAPFSFFIIFLMHLQCKVNDIELKHRHIAETEL